MKSLFFFLLIMVVSSAYPQKPSVQIIKGQVVDDISKSPIPDAAVTLNGNSSITGVTNKDGFFTLLNVPVGRQTIIISSMGYETQVINEMLVTSGKEVIIHSFLIEKITHLNEIVVKAINKRLVKNAMVTVSGRAFNADDTRKYAGSLGDPSRMVTGFAGVSSSNDSRNDIIVRGNSPNG
ncbi:MAG: carboxypeptidase-like regulatory domain-containing protein, partial [Ferruginibacter sp.]